MISSSTTTVAARFTLCLLIATGLRAADTTVITAIFPDTGISPTDFITANGAPVVRGTAPPGSSVELFSGTDPVTLTKVGTAPAGATGAWTIAAGAVPDGRRLLEARALPVGGGPAVVSARRVLVIDTSGTAPSLTWILPRAGADGYTNSLRPVLSGVGDPGATIIVLIDGVPVATTTADAVTGAYTYTCRSLANGTYTVGVQQRDLAGNTPAPAISTTVVVDTRIAKPLIYRSTVGPAGTLTNNPDPGFAGKAEPLSTVVLHTGSAIGPVVGTVTADAQGTWNLTSLGTTVADGTVTFFAVATDPAGNTAASDPFPLTVDTVPPSALAATGFTVTGAGTPVTTPAGERRLTWSGTASGAATVEVTMDGVTVATVPVVGGVWSYGFIADLPDHAYTLGATARDAAGNARGPVAAAITIADPTDPAAERLTPVILEAISTPQRTLRTPTVGFTIVGQPSATVRVVYTVVTPGAALGTVSTSLDPGGTRTVTSPSLADGTYDITVEHARAGTTFTSLPLRVTIDRTAPTGPGAVSATDDTGSLADDLVTRDTTPRLTVSGAADAAPSSGGLRISATLDSVLLGSAAVVAGGIVLDAPYVLPDGVYTLGFTEADAAGNTSTTVLAPRTLVIDTVTDTPFITSLSPDTGRDQADGLVNVGSGLQLSGRAEDGATVAITVTGASFGSAQTVTAIADAAGNWRVTLPTLTTPGLHTCIAQATDVAGNVSAPSDDFQLTYDPVPPVTVITAFAPNTGNPVDNRTNATALTITGTSEPGAEVTVRLDVDHVVTVRADGIGAWSVPFAGLADGTYTVTAGGLDAAGNLGATVSAPSFVVVDTTVATPAIAGVTDDTSGGSVIAWNGDLLTMDQTLLISGIFGGTPIADGDVFELLLAGTVVATQTPVSAATSWSVDRTGVTQVPGSYALTARLTDDVGNVATAATTLVIDRTAPTATISAVTPDTGISASDFETNATQLTALSGGTADNRRTGTVLVELLSPTSAVIYTATTVVDGAATWQVAGTAGTPALNTLVLTGTPPTTYTIRVTPTDAAGNSGTPVTRPLVIDNEAPVSATATIASFTINSGTALANVSGSLTSDNTPTLVGTTTGTPVGGYVTIYGDTTGTAVLGRATVDGSGAWTFTSPVRTDGTARFTARVFDKAGNAASTLSPVFDVIVDTTRPTLAIRSVTDDTTGAGTSGTAADFVTRDNQPVFAGTVTDLHLTAGTGSVKATLPGVITDLAVPFAGGAWTLDRSAAPGIADGTYTLSLTAADDVANASTVTRILVIDTAVAAPTARLDAASDTGSSAADQVTNDTTPTITGAAEPGAAITVVLTPAGGAPIARTVQANGSGAWTVTFPVLADGVWTMGATQIDPAGNGPSAAAAGALTIDTAIPAAPTLVLTTGSDTGSSATDHVTNDTTPTWSGSAEPFARVTVTCTNGKAIFPITVDADAGGNWTATSPALTAGTWTVVATQRDLAGNGPSAGATLAPALVIDIAVAAPAITAVDTDSGRGGSDPAGLTSGRDFITNDTSLILSGTAEAGALVTLLRGGSPIGTATASATGAWSIADPTLQIHGAVPAYTARQQDPAGNTSALSSVRTVTIDTRAPAVPVIVSLADLTAADPATGVTRDPTLVLTGTAEAAALITVLLEGNPIGTALANGSGAWTYGPSAAVAEGPHAFTAVATDIAGNAGPASAPVAITVDLTAPAAPVITGLSPVDDSGDSAADGLTNRPRPAIVGRGEPGATVTVRDGATVIGTTVVAADGTWSLAPTADLGDGPHVLSATVTDVAGNVSGPSAVLRVTIDRVTPPPTFTGITTDSGASGSDFVTNDPTPVLRGTAEPGATVTVSDGITMLGTVIADASGAWSLPAVLAEGSHAISVRAVDSAGNAADGISTQDVVIDLTAPVAAVTGIGQDTGDSATDAITADSGLVFSGNAEALALVTVRLDGIAIGTVTADAAGAWSFDYSAVTLASGTYRLTATATDRAGNTGAPSAPLTVVVDRDNPAPVVYGLTPATDTGVSDHDGITADPAPTITGRADPGTRVTVIIDGIDRGQATVAADGTWTFSLVGQPLADGTYLVGARSVDVAGNTTVATATYPIRIGTAISVPAITGLGPDTGVSATDRITTATAPTIGGSGVPGATITVTIDGADAGTATVAADGSWSLILPASPDGTHTLVATQTDASGAAGVSLPVTYVIDTAAPPVPTLVGIAPDTGSDAGDRLTASTTPVLRGTGEPGSVVTVRDGAAIIGTATVGADGVWTLQVPLAEGTHDLTFVATDTAGNASPASPPATVRVDATAPPAGIISGIAPDTGRDPADRITTATTPLISGSGEPGAIVELYAGTTLIGTTTVGADGRWSVTPAMPLADGPTALTTVVVDAAGNRSPASPEVPLVIDTRPPAAPLIAAIGTDTGASDHDGITADRTLLVSGTAEPGSRVSLIIDGTVVGSAITAADGRWAVDLTGRPLVDGAYGLVARAEDVAGNASADSAVFSLVIDTGIRLPVIAGVTADTGVPGDHLTADDTPTVTGSAEPGATVQVTRDGVVVATVVAAADGTWSADLGPAILADGTYTLGAIATDAAGNVATATAWSLTIDATAPAAPVITGIGDDSGIPGDFLTNDQTLVFSGTAEPGARVTVAIGGFAIGEAVADTSGAWTVDYTAVTLAGDPQPGGRRYAVTATATDVAGNTSQPSATREIGIDADVSNAVAVLLVTTDSGVIGDHLTSDTTPTIVGVAEPGSVVEVFDGATLLGTATASSLGLWSLDLVFPAGETDHLLTVTATDTAGNHSGPSPGYALRIDTVAPPAPTITGIGADTGTAADFATADPTLLISGRAEPLASVQVLLAGVPVGTATTDAAGEWTFDFTAVSLPDGTYDLTAIATDGAGNVGPAAVVRTITVDTVVPAPLLLASGPDTGVPGDGLTAVAQQTVSGRAEPGSTVTLQVDGVAVGTAIAAADGTWAIGPTVTLTDGEHVFTATAVDVAGNTSPAADPLTVIIDAGIAPPLITGVSPGTLGETGTALSGSSAPVLSGRAEPGASVAITVDGVRVGTVVAAVDGSWSLPLTGLADGEHRITTTAFDAAGNSAAGTDLILTVDTVIAPPVLLGIDADSGIPDDRVTNVDRQTVNGRAEPGATVTLRVDGMDVGSAVAAADGTWAIGPTGILADGSHVFTAIAVDTAGNVSAPAEPLTVLIDTAIAAPVITGIAPGSLTAPGTAITASAAPVLSGAADPGTTLSITVDGVVIGTIVVAADGRWTQPLAPLAEGDHAIAVTAVDAAGNAAASTLDLQVDLSGPVGTAITALIGGDTAVADGGTCADRTPEIRGVGEPGSSVEIFADGVLLGSTVVAADGTWTFTPTADIPGNGSVVLIAQTRDPVGNPGAVSAPWRVTLFTSRSVEIEGERCGLGTNIACIGLLLAACLRLGLRGPRGGGIAAVLLAGLVLALPTALVAEDPAVPAVPMRYGAKFDAPWSAVSPAAETPLPGSDGGPWRELRLSVLAMPAPDQDADYLRAGYGPGDSSWDTTIRADLQWFRHASDRAWGGFLCGASLGFFQVRGDEQPATATAPHFDYRIDTLPIDTEAGLRLGNGRSWLELRGLLGLGLTRIAIDAPASLAGNLEAATGSSYGAYTEYGLAAALVSRLDRWTLVGEARYLRGMHNGAFARNEYINGDLVQHDSFEVRLRQTGFAFGLGLGRSF